MLRDHVRRPALWIPINTFAWLLGIAWTLGPSPVVDQSTPAGALILIYGIAGFCMAATVAVVTGVGMIRLYSRRSRWMTGARRTKPGESVVRPMRTSNSQAPNVGVGFIFGRLQLELDVESRDPIMDRNHRIQVEL